MDINYFIYYLSDPRTNIIRYIGQSRQKLNYRYTAHLGVARKGVDKGDKSIWIKELLSIGLRPNINLLEIHNNQKEADLAEIFFIDIFKKIGHKITNQQLGGRSGYVAGKLSKETIEKIKASRTPDFLKKQSERQYKKVVQLTRDGEVVKIWDSIKFASEYGGFSRRLISECCCGRKKSHKNFIWRRFDG